jgi:hypothetical protein
MLVGARCCFESTTGVFTLEKSIFWLSAIMASMAALISSTANSTCVSSCIQVVDTAVVCRQHDIPERVTKDAGEFPVEVTKDIELRRAATITKELSNGGLESPHVELDHGVMWEGEGKEFQGGSLRAGAVF